MNFRYSPLQRKLKILYRKISPVPVSPWTTGEVEDQFLLHVFQKMVKGIL